MPDLGDGRRRRHADRAESSASWRCNILSLKLGETAFINNLVILGTVLVLLVLLMPRGIVPTLHDWLRKGVALVRQPSRGGAP